MTTVEHVSKVAKKENDGYTSLNDRIASKLSRVMVMMAMLQTAFSCIISELGTINGNICDVRELFTKRLSKANDLFNKVKPARDIGATLSNLSLYYAPTFGVVSTISPVSASLKGKEFTGAFMKGIIFHIMPKALLAVTSGIMTYAQAQKADSSFNLKLGESLNDAVTRQSKNCLATVDADNTTNQYIAQAIMSGYTVERNAVIIG